MWFLNHSISFPFPWDCLNRPFFSHLTLHNLQQAQAYIRDPGMDVVSTVTIVSVRTPLDDFFDG